MKKQEVPIVVADVLKEVSEKVKEFNSKSDFKLVAKSSDDFLLKIYPKGYEDLFFQIDDFKIRGIDEQSLTLKVAFNLSIN